MRHTKGIKNRSGTELLRIFSGHLLTLEPVYSCLILATYEDETKLKLTNAFLQVLNDFEILKMRPGNIYDERTLSHSTRSFSIIMLEEFKQHVYLPSCGLVPYAVRSVKSLHMHHYDAKLKGAINHIEALMANVKLSKAATTNPEELLPRCITPPGLGVLARLYRLYETTTEERSKFPLVSLSPDHPYMQPNRQNGHFNATLDRKIAAVWSEKLRTEGRLFEEPPPPVLEVKIGEIPLRFQFPVSSEISLVTEEENVENMDGFSISNNETQEDMEYTDYGSESLPQIYVGDMDWADADE